MDAREDNIEDRMRRLVALSCKFDALPNLEFQKLHRSLLKFYFNAVQVQIDYDQKIISINNSKPLTTDPIRLYDLKDAIADKVGYSNLEETLNGCLEKGHLQTNFYKKLISEYSDLFEGNNGFMSA